MGQKIKFGRVTVAVDPPSADEVSRNVARSTDALARATAKLARPGIRLRPRKDVPLFYVDTDHAGQFIRELNGKREEVKAAIKWLEKNGVNVEPVEINVIES